MMSFHGWRNYVLHLQRERGLQNPRYPQDEREFVALVRELQKSTLHNPIDDREKGVVAFAEALAAELNAPPPEAP